MTPEKDPLLCEPGTYAYTLYDLSEEISIHGAVMGFPANSAQWVVSCGELVQPLVEGNTTLHLRILLGLRNYYLDLSLQGNELVVRTRLAQPDWHGHLRQKPDFGLEISIHAEEVQPSGLTLRRRATLPVPLPGVRKEYESKYTEM